LRRPPSTHTQSVKVPPVSMAIRSAGWSALPINREDYHVGTFGTANPVNAPQFVWGRAYGPSGRGEAPLPHSARNVTAPHGRTAVF
jgi:hypothetical protein